MQISEINLLHKFKEIISSQSSPLCVLKDLNYLDKEYADFCRYFDLSYGEFSAALYFMKLFEVIRTGNIQILSRMRLPTRSFLPRIFSDTLNNIVLDPDGIEIEDKYHSELVNLSESRQEMINKLIKEIDDRLYYLKLMGVGSDVIFSILKPTKEDLPEFWVTNDYQIFLCVSEETMSWKRLDSPPTIAVPIKIGNSSLDRAILCFFAHHPQRPFGIKNLMDIPYIDEIYSYYEEIENQKFYGVKGKVEDLQKQINRSKKKKDFGSGSEELKEEIIRKFRERRISDSFYNIKKSLIDVFGEMTYLRLFGNFDGSTMQLPYSFEKINFSNMSYDEILNLYLSSLHYYGSNFFRED